MTEKKGNSFFNHPIKMESELNPADAVRVTTGYNDDGGYTYCAVLHPTIVKRIKEVCVKHSLNEENSLFLTAFTNLSARYMMLVNTDEERVYRAVKMMNYLRSLLKEQFNLEIPEKLLHHMLDHFKNQKNEQ